MLFVGAMSVLCLELVVLLWQRCQIAFSVPSIVFVVAMVVLEFVVMWC